MTVAEKQRRVAVAALSCALLGFHLFAFLKTIPRSALGNFSVGSVWAIGNLLFAGGNVVTDPNGLAVFDIGDPANPILLDLASVEADYASAPYGNSYFQLTRASQGGVMTVTSTEEAANLEVVSSLDLSGDLIPGDVIYILFQDEFAHLPAFNYYGKMRLEDFSLIDVTPFDENQAVTSGSDLILISSTVGSGNVSSVFRNDSRPVMRASVFTYEDGAELADGSTAAGRRIGMYMRDNSAAVWAVAGEQLFEQAVAWMLGQ